MIQAEEHKQLERIAIDLEHKFPFFAKRDIYKTVRDAYKKDRAIYKRVITENDLVEVEKMAEQELTLSLQY